MSFMDYLRWIFKAVWIQKVRSALTVLGFAIGIAAMVLLSSMGEGLRLYVMDTFSQFGSHIIAITPGKTETFGISGILKTTRPLTLADANAVEQLPAIEGMMPMVIGTAAIKHGNRTRHTDVAGVSAMAPMMWKLYMAQGIFLPREDLDRARAFVVLGSKLSKELFGAVSPLGEYIHAGASRFRVIGVLAPKGQFMGTDLDDMAYIPVARAMDLFNRESLMELDVMHSANVSADLVSKRVSDLLIRRHGMEDFTIITQDQALSTLDNILNILKYAAAGLGAVSLLVGGVGILTILMITVSERTQEVGLLRALGVTRGQIRLMFLGEAVMISLVGAAAGIITIAILLAVLSQLAPGLPVALSAPIVILALLTATFVGLVSGVQPAVNATRMSPIDALRAE